MKAPRLLGLFNNTQAPVKKKGLSPQHKAENSLWNKAGCQTQSNALLSEIDNVHKPGQGL